MIEKKFTTTFSVIRQGWTTEIVGEETIDKSEESTVSAFKGYRQQTTADYIQSLGLEITRPHTVWCSLGSNVVEGDVISSTYGRDKVRFVQNNPDGANAHKELIVEHIGEEIPAGSESE